MLMNGTNFSGVLCGLVAVHRGGCEVCICGDKPSFNFLVLPMNNLFSESMSCVMLCCQGIV